VVDLCGKRVEGNRLELSAAAVAGPIGQTGALLELLGSEPVEQEGVEPDGRAAAAVPIGRPSCSGGGGPDPAGGGSVGAANDGSAKVAAKAGGGGPAPTGGGVELGRRGTGGGGRIAGTMPAPRWLGRARDGR
jgi:hypothetical protein